MSKATGVPLLEKLNKSLLILKLAQKKRILKPFALRY